MDEDTKGDESAPQTEVYQQYPPDWPDTEPLDPGRPVGYLPATVLAAYTGRHPEHIRAIARAHPHIPRVPDPTHQQRQLYYAQQVYRITDKMRKTGTRTRAIYGVWDKTGEPVTIHVPEDPKVTAMKARRKAAKKEVAQT